MSTDLGARVRNREIRDWGRGNGWPELDDRGRIPDDLREAYETAHPGGVTDVGVTIIEPGPAEPLGASVPVADDLPPAPRNLDEARQQAARLPASAHLKRTRKQREPKQQEPDIKVTPKVIGDIEGKLAFWLGLTAEPWAVADPYCGKAYADQVPEIARKLAPIMAQSPDVVRWFAKSTTFILWTELGMAVRPIATAVVKHHVTKTVKLVADEKGAPVPVPAPAGGVDFSAYASRPAA